MLLYKLNLNFSQILVIPRDLQYRLLIIQHLNAILVSLPSVDGEGTVFLAEDYYQIEGDLNLISTILTQSILNPVLPMILCLIHFPSIGFLFAELCLV